MSEQEYPEHLVQTKDDIKANLERTQIAMTVIKALSYGVEVKIKWGKEQHYILSMYEGKTYIKGRSYSGADDLNDPNGGKPTYLGFGCTVTLDSLIDCCCDSAKDDPTWLSKIRGELAAAVALNKIV